MANTLGLAGENRIKPLYKNHLTLESEYSRVNILFDFVNPPQTALIVPAHQCVDASMIFYRRRLDV